MLDVCGESVKVRQARQHKHHTQHYINGKWYRTYPPITAEAQHIAHNSPGCVVIGLVNKQLPLSGHNTEVIPQPGRSPAIHEPCIKTG